MNDLTDARFVESTIGYLEKQGYSVIQWIKFDPNDKSTWPDVETEYLVWEGSYVNVDEPVIDEYRESCNWTDVSTTHWCELPKLKEREK